MTANHERIVVAIRRHMGVAMTHLQSARFAMARGNDGAAAHAIENAAHEAALAGWWASPPGQAPDEPWP